MKFLFIYIILFISFLNSDEYKIGHGLKINEYLHVGGYFSMDYSSSDEKKQFRLDDVAFLAYGEITPRISYLVELEAAPFYTKNYTDHTSTRDRKFKYERAYVNYMHSEMINIRLGKLITPIGYWNLEPINILRDTSSNPEYSNKIFPKLLTGIDISGFIDEDATFKYHLFLQNNKDLDADYINIENEDFLGLSLEYDATSEFSIGGSLSKYITVSNNKHVLVSQVNAKYDMYPYIFQAEVAHSDIDNKALNINSDNMAGYMQGIYHISDQHAIVGRYEFFDNDELNIFNKIGVIGYSYRPLYSVSFKAEYQLNSDSRKSKAIASFSVLF